MDEKRKGGFEKKGQGKQMNYDSYFSPGKSKQGDFKISTGDESLDTQWEKPVVQRSQTSQSRQRQSRPVESNKNFNVSVPQKNSSQNSNTRQQIRSPQAAQMSQIRQIQPQRQPVQQQRQSVQQQRQPVQVQRQPVQQQRQPVQPQRQPVQTQRQTSQAQRQPVQTQRQTGQAQSHQSVAKQTTAAKRTSAKSASKKRTSTKRQPPRRKGAGVAKGFLTFIVCVLCIAIVTITASSVAMSTINDIFAIDKKDSDSVSVVVPANASFNQVIDLLHDNGLIKQKTLVKLFCKFRHYDKYYSKKEGKKVAVKYQQGVYYLDTNSGVETMLETIMDANTAKKETVKLTFPEGWTVAQIFEKIEKYKVCEAQKLYSNLDIIGKQFDFYEKLENTTGRYLKAEGFLFPDTYEFYIGENASSVLKKLFKNFQAKWTSELQKKAAEKGMSLDTVITIASIIQREAKDRSQMKDISSVIHNRLADLESYPQLQCNSTQDYIDTMKELGVITDSYYSIYLSAYNTYSAQGLPPGPICNPGLSAIEAAIEPNDTNYHFFCHDKNGKLYLAATAQEHKINTEKVLYENGENQ